MILGPGEIFQRAMLLADPSSFIGRSPTALGGAIADDRLLGRSGAAKVIPRPAQYQRAESARKTRKTGAVPKASPGSIPAANPGLAGSGGFEPIKHLVG